MVDELGRLGELRAARLRLDEEELDLIDRARYAGRGGPSAVTTMVAEFGDPGFGLYGSSKAALVLLTKSWAAEYGSHGVRVNAVSPGPTLTSGTAPMGDALDQQAAQAP
ncbi:SDR family oxidoreductase, partial [Micromonospora azadirachtae]